LDIDEDALSEERSVVFVSGGSRGLGLAIVEALLQQGHSVATFSRRTSIEIERLSVKYGERFAVLTGDLGDPAGLAAIVRQSEERLGPLTGLINNAGMVDEALLARQSIEAINRLVDVNLRGTLLLTRQAIRGMMIRRRGRIINISSIASVRGYKGTVAYSATKGAIDAMTRALARELGGRNITVNSVAPGYMETELTANMDAAQLRQIVRRTPLGRPGRVQDVVGVVLFLLSEAAAFISGQTIVVDGGLTA
jgi:3-oxoacyl-[acyl-carrier protein] reductase